MVKNSLAKSLNNTPLLKLLAGHVTLTVLMIAACRCSLLSAYTVGLLATGYSLILLYAFYFNLYRELKNRLAFEIWLLVAVMQYAIYYFSGHMADLLDVLGPILRPMQSLLIFLVLFQLLRQVALKIYHKEPVFMSRERANLTALEYVASIILFLAPLISCF